MIVMCNKCKEVFENDYDLIEDSGKLYCEECYEEILKDEEENEDE
jgi:formylmethanofuran dehydrogenase subunit E